MYTSGYMESLKQHTRGRIRLCLQSLAICGFLQSLRNPEDRILITINN